MEPKLVKKFNKAYYVCPYCYTVQTKITVSKGRTRYFYKFKKWWDIKIENYKNLLCFACDGKILFPPILWEN